MVLDGNLDPVAWTTYDHTNLPMFLRDRSAAASEQVLGNYLDLCGQASTSGCAFSAGSPDATRAKYATLLDRLRRNPVHTDGTVLPPVCGYDCGVALVPLGSVADWQQGATILQQLWTASSAGNTVTGATVTGSAAKSPADDSLYTGHEQNLAVLCSDGPEPRDPNAYAGFAAYGGQQWGPEGMSMTWPTEACAGWPQGVDAYTGPWNRPTAGTVLVIGNTGDPVTAYQDSVNMSQDLGKARLLTVDGYGHTEVQNPDPCATNYLLSYLGTGALPAKGTVCQQDATPFA
jgi:hypothetical protein